MTAYYSGHPIIADTLATQCRNAVRFVSGSCQVRVRFVSGSCQVRVSYYRTRVRTRVRTRIKNRVSVRTQTFFDSWRKSIPTKEEKYDRRDRD